MWYKTQVARGKASRKLNHQARVISENQTPHWNLLWKCEWPENERRFWDFDIFSAIIWNNIKKCNLSPGHLHPIFDSISCSTCVIYFFLSKCPFYQSSFNLKKLSWSSSSYEVVGVTAPNCAREKLQEKVSSQNWIYYSTTQGKARGADICCQIYFWSMWFFWDFDLKQMLYVAYMNISAAHFENYKP